MMFQDSGDCSQFRPQGARLLVEMDEDSITSQHLSQLIILPSIIEDKNKKIVTGVIRAAGTGRWVKGKRVLIDDALKVGSRVIFGYYMGDHLFNHAGKAKLRVLGDMQVIGVPSDDNDWSKLQPVNDRVLLKLDAPGGQTVSGLFLPERSKVHQRMRTAIVVAVGSGLRHDGRIEPMEVKPGDRVLFQGMNGIEVKIGEDDHIVLPQSVLLGVVDGEAPNLTETW